MKKKIIIIISSLLFLFLISGILFVKIGTSPVNKKDNKEVIFTVAPGESRYNIVSNLKKAGLVKNKLSGYLFVTLHHNLKPQAADYSLNRTMSLKQIFTKFDKGEKYDNRVSVSLSFVPGKRVTNYADIIADFVNKYQKPDKKVTREEIINEINDKEYIKELINKYWFLTDEVLDDEIYYSLEGYLQPDTYQFYTTSTVKEIIERMLQNTDKKLKPFEEEIKNSGYTVHEILSAAAIIEKEANSYEDRTKVSQVIRKRLSIDMPLGMDVTAYYAAKVEQTKDNPYMYAWNFLPSKYNTRNKDNIGLPIGPICNPSISSIKAALNPSNTNYVYFYADIDTGKVYFANDYAEFIEIQRKLGVS